jgi:hypothetical protein
LSGSQPLPVPLARQLAQRLLDGQLALFVGAGLSHGTIGGGGPGILFKTFNGDINIRQGRG